ncbi:hypothetical protein [Streptomyces xylophagus]|uniref:hypothetical protein n=1 Tax=Streptomyces xylophagus TaxID=285514 RepID=UPI0005BD65CA|nr:hypothetical protein [Streptomyces xylophagus]
MPGSWAPLPVPAVTRLAAVAALLWIAHFCLAPVLSVAAAPVFQHGLGLDRLTALSAGVAVGCGMLAFAVTTVVSLRAREPLPALGRPVSGDRREAAVAGAARRGSPR